MIEKITHNEVRFVNRELDRQRLATTVDGYAYITCLIDNESYCFDECNVLRMGGRYLEAVYFAMPLAFD